MKSSSSSRAKWIWVGFFLLCLISSAEWVIPSAMVGLPSLERQGVMYAVTGSGAALFGWRGLRRLSWRWIAVGSGGLFGLPAILLDAVSGRIPSTSVSVLFAIVPVIVLLVIAMGAWGRSDDGGGRRLLAPALVAVGGAMAVLPFDFPASAQGWVAFAVVFGAVVLAGVAAVWLHQVLGGAVMLEAVAIAGIVNAVLLLGWCGLRGIFVWRLGEMVQGISVLFFVRMVEFVLTLWLLREMEPVRFSARYLVIPLMTIAEGVVALRPEVTVRLVVGVLLLGGGACWVIAAKTQDEGAGLSLR